SNSSSSDIFFNNAPRAAIIAREELESVRGKSSTNGISVIEFCSANEFICANARGIDGVKKKIPKISSSVMAPMDIFGAKFLGGLAERLFMFCWRHSVGVTPKRFLNIVLKSPRCRQPLS